MMTSSHETRCRAAQRTLLIHRCLRLRSRSLRNLPQSFPVSAADVAAAAVLATRSLRT